MCKVLPTADMVNAMKLLALITSSFFQKINLFIYLFMAVLGLRCCAQAFLVAGSGSYSLLRCMGFSSQWLLLLRSVGSRRAGFSSCGTRAQ